MLNIKPIFEKFKLLNFFPPLTEKQFIFKAMGFFSLNLNDNFLTS